MGNDTASLGVALRLGSLPQSPAFRRDLPAESAKSRRREWCPKVMEHVLLHNFKHCAWIGHEVSHCSAWSAGRPGKPSAVPSAGPYVSPLNFRAEPPTPVGQVPRRLLE